MNSYMCFFISTLLLVMMSGFTGEKAQSTEAPTQLEHQRVLVSTGVENASGIVHGDPGDRPEILIVGGGASHNFERWFNLEDSKILTHAGANVRYTSEVEYVKEMLPELDILYLSNNQPMPDPELREAIFEFVESGNDLLLVRAATWYNWEGWTDYNSSLVTGGRSGPDECGNYKDKAEKADHPNIEGTPASF